MAQNPVITILPSAARTTSQDSGNLDNKVNGRGVRVVVDVTATPGSAPSLVVTVQGRDPLSGKVYTLLASAAITAVGTTVLTVYPGLTAAANVTANNVLPAVWKVIVTAGNSNAATYSVGAEILK